MKITGTDHDIILDCKDELVLLRNSTFTLIMLPLPCGVRFQNWVGCYTTESFLGKLHALKAAILFIFTKRPADKCV